MRPLCRPSSLHQFPPTGAEAPDKTDPSLANTSLAFSVFRHSSEYEQSRRPQGCFLHAGSHCRPLVIACMLGSGIASRTGLVNPKTPNTGIRSATPRCISPESFDTNAAQCMMSAAVTGQLSLTQN